MTGDILGNHQTVCLRGCVLLLYFSAAFTHSALPAQAPCHGVAVAAVEHAYVVQVCTPAAYEPHVQHMLLLLLVNAAAGTH